MQILVSSKVFYAAFKEIIDEQILSVRIDDKRNFIVRTAKNELQISCCETKEKNQLALQHNVRWDWLLQTIGSLSERPIVILFDNNKCSFTLDF